MNELIQNGPHGDKGNKEPAEPKVPEKRPGQDAPPDDDEAAIKAANAELNTGWSLVCFLLLLCISYFKKCCVQRCFRGEVSAGGWGAFEGWRLFVCRECFFERIYPLFKVVKLAELDSI